MFYEYALDPEILSDVARCRTFFGSFNNRSSRLIADVPKNWQQDAFQVINKLPHETCKPVLKKTLKENLKKLLRENLNKNRGVTGTASGETWEDVVVQEDNKFHFAAAFSVAARTSPVKIYAFDDLLFSGPICWNSKDQQYVERKAKAIVDAMAPLLLVSKSIRLVDPHFSFILPTWGRYEPILKELVGRLGLFNFGRGISTISIHTSDKTGSMSHQLQEGVKRWLPGGVTIKVYHWPQGDMHDRFLLTDVGGLYFGHGLDEFSPGRSEKVLVSVLDNDTYRTELAKVSSVAPLSYQHPDG